MNRIAIKKAHDAPVPPDPGSPKRASVLPTILVRLEDPSASVGELNRLIAIEIAGIADAMQKDEEIGAPKSASKSALEQIKALRLLSRTLAESYVPDSRDVLDLHGPKFLFVLSKISGCLDDALIKATGKPLNDLLNQLIRREFNDLIRVRAQEIKHAIDDPKFSFDVEGKAPTR